MLAPTFAKLLADPKIKTVAIAGCGGGFDFISGCALFPELVRLGKRIVVASYSFGSPGRIGGVAPVVWQHESCVDGGLPVVCKLVSAASEAHPAYGPEVHLATFLDAQFPERAPHSIYAMYARSFTVAMLEELYTKIVDDEAVDAFVLADGGSDSLMKGDEQGLGDPIEDAVSVAAIAGLRCPRLQLRMLLCMGIGCDRHNCVSDASSLRAIAELTRAGGFLGCISLEPHSELCSFYRGLVDHTYSQQSFRSVVSGSILAASEGRFGTRDLTPDLLLRTRGAETLFLWPIMAQIWAFDVGAVAKRSIICSIVRDSSSTQETLQRLRYVRAQLGVRPVENLPRHEDIAHDKGRSRHYLPAI